MSTSQLHKVLLKYFYIYITTSKEIAVMRKREVTSIFQEIIRVYPYLSPPTLSSGDSTRVCNALSLFQVLSHVNFPYLSLFCLS